MSSISSYSSKDLGALYYEDRRPLREKVQQASVLMTVEDGYWQLDTMVTNIMLLYRYLGLGDIIWD